MKNYEMKTPLLDDIGGDVEKVDEGTQKKIKMLIQEMTHERTGLSVSDRYNYNSLHIACFTGSAFVNWILRKNYASDRGEASKIAVKLIDLGYISRSGKHTVFIDSYYAYFRFTVKKNPELFAGILTEDEMKRLESSPTKKPFLTVFPASIFTIVMGIVGIANVFLNMYKLYPNYMALMAVGSVFVLTGAILWCGFFVLYVLKILYQFDSFWDEWLHLDKCHFFCTISISLLLLSDCALLVSQPLSMTLWGIASVAQIFFALIIVAKWIVARIKIQEVTPVFFLPVVGLVVIPITGAKLGYLEFGRILFGMGAFYYFVTFVIFWHRMLFEGMLIEKAVPRLFIAIAPPSLLSISYSLLSGGFDVIPQMLFGTALFTAFLMFTLRFTQEAVPFTLAWWAYVFPLASLSVAAWSFHGYVMFSNAMIYTLSFSVAVLTTIVVLLALLYVSIFSVWTLVRRRYILPCFSKPKIEE